MGPHPPSHGSLKKPLIRGYVSVYSIVFLPAICVLCLASSPFFHVFAGFFCSALNISFRGQLGVMIPPPCKGFSCQFPSHAKRERRQFFFRHSLRSKELLLDSPPTVYVLLFCCCFLRDLGHTGQFSLICGWTSDKLSSKFCARWPKMTFGHNFFL